MKQTYFWHTFQSSGLCQQNSVRFLSVCCSLFFYSRLFYGRCMQIDLLRYFKTGGTWRTIMVVLNRSPDGNSGPVTMKHNLQGPIFTTDTSHLVNQILGYFACQWPQPEIFIAAKTLITRIKTLKRVLWKIYNRLIRWIKNVLCKIIWTSRKNH